MNAKSVKELMIPLDDYAVVPCDATLVEAIRALRYVDRELGRARQPARAVLVVDPEGMVIGQVGHLEMLQALEPKYCLLGDLGTLSRAGVSEELLGSLTENLSFWSGDLKSVCRRVRNLKVVELMRPIEESISEDAPLSEAIHALVIRQSMRVLVTRRGRVVGVLRLADLLGEVADCIESADVGDRSTQELERDVSSCSVKTTNYDG